MNLPALAIEFLDAFKGLYRPLYELEGAREAVEEAGEAALPMVHCYCFTKSPETAEEDILEVSSALPRSPVGEHDTDRRFSLSPTASLQGARHAHHPGGKGLPSPLRARCCAEEGDVLPRVQAVEGDGRVALATFLPIDCC